MRDVLARVGNLHASDVADLLEHMDAEDERLRLLAVLPASLASDTLAEMEDEENPGELLSRMEPTRIAELVEELADDDAADLIGDLEPHQQERVLDSVSDQEEEEIRELLKYEEESAGGIMTRELLSVRSDATAAQAIEQLRERAGDREDFYTIFVVDPDGRLREHEGIVASSDSLVLDHCAAWVDLPSAVLAHLPDPVWRLDLDVDIP